MVINKCALFGENWKELNSPDHSIIINQGGMASGKTYNIIDCIMLYCANNAGIVATITSANFPSLRRGAIRDCQNIWANSGIYKQMYPKAPTINGVRCVNGSVIEFCSFYNREVAKGAKRDLLFINEATAFSYEIAFELINRTKGKVFIDFNPNTRFWVHEKFEGVKDAIFIYSTHKANDFLPKKMHEAIELLRKTDPQRYRVYGLGECGAVDGLVYKDWAQIEELPEDFKQRTYGLDFGFTNDPTALVEIRYVNGSIYLDELCYERNLLNNNIADILRQLPKGDPIMADSAEMKSIAEIRRQNVPNIFPAVKGAGSILQGIDLVKSMKIYVTKRSENLKSELLNYRWTKDKLDHNINKPVGPDHLLDAVRYGVKRLFLHEGRPNSSLGNFI